jgi:carbon storage regulator CsrA
MLVLSRKQKQEILIGDDVKVTVLQVKGNTVRLGIEAPRNVKVIRGELPRKTESEPMANVTIVFNNTVDRSDCLAGREPEVLKFNQESDGATESVSFRECTPPPLRHHHLKRIVRDIASSK